MSSGTDFEARVAAVAAAVDELLAAPMTACTDQQVLASAREVEQARLRLESFDHALIGELDSRALPARLLARSTAGLLGALLRLSPGQAARRVHHARQLGRRLTLTGEALPPAHPAVAEARERGLINGEHAAIAVRTLAQLPGRLPVEQLNAAEAFLAGWARKTNPAQLSQIARRLRDTLDPDGALTEPADQARRRGLTVTPIGDGMHRLSGELDAECAALATTVLQSLSAPRPTDAGGPDPRNASQRRHDALKSVLKLGARAGQLPVSGGVPATVLITLTADQLAERAGLAETSFGQLLPVETALKLADQAALAVIISDSKGKPLQLGRSRRLASEHQTLALIARDRGCTFPGCTMPPEWSERHHITAWADGGQTDLDNLCLLCDYHHDHHVRQGWTTAMRDGIAWYTAPPWLDPGQTAQRNHRFDDRAGPRDDRAGPRDDPAGSSSRSAGSSSRSAGSSSPSAGSGSPLSGRSDR